MGALGPFNGGSGNELAWGRQAIDCLGNEMGVDTYKRRDIWELELGVAIEDFWELWRWRV
jgi:hypothetical protein